MIPVGVNVLIKIDDEPEKIGSIIVPDTVSKKHGKGTVVALGTAKDYDFEVEVGSRVTFSAIKAEHAIDGYMVIPKSEILYWE